MPRVRSVPPYVASRGGEAVEVARQFGLAPDPFQELVIEDACGVREDGRWAAFEVGVNVSRQNGKGGILEVRELAGLFAWGERMILHSSHEFQTSMEAMLRMEELLAGWPEFASQVKSVSRSHGSEGFVLRSGQRLRYRTRTKGGGRGFTGDTLMLDEAMVLPEMFIGALLPTLSGRSMSGNPQVWYTGSAVDRFVHEHGVVFARIRARGLRGEDPSLAYFEWSAADASVTPDDLDEDVLADPEAWAEANPGLGLRISEEHVEKERRSMDPRTFAVERLGVGDWPAIDGDSGVIDAETWAALADTGSVAEDPVAFAFDVTPDRSSGAIGVAGGRPGGGCHVEVVDHHRGTGWMVARVAELVGRHRPRAVVCDAAGPASSLLPELERLGIAVTAVSAGDHGRACGLFFDAVEQGTLRHLGTPELAAAVRGATQRPLGDAWAWSRRHSGVDIAPLVACTLALWGAVTGLDFEPWTGAW